MSPLAEALRNRRNEIVRRWAERVRERLGEAGPAPALLDSLPQYVDALAAALEARGGPDAGEAARIAAEHGAQRSVLGIEVDQLVLEYRLLRQVVVEVARESTGVGADDVLALSDLLIEGAASALRAWSEERQAVLRRASTLLDLGDAFFELDRDWRFVRVNSNQERLSGKKRGETLGRNFWEIWPDLTRAGNPYWEEYHRVMDERVPREFDAYYAPLDLWAAVTAYPIEGGGIAVFFRDASPRKRAERRLAEALAVLEGIFASAPVGLALVDRELRYVRMNDALAALRGVRPEDVVGRTLREVFPALAAVLEPRYRQVLATGEPVLDVEFSSPMTSGPGWHLGSWFPIRDAAGEVFLVGAVVVDITRRKHDEEELRRAREFEQQLIGIASHDLRNPLGAVLFGASTLLSKEDLPDRHLRAVARIRSAAERATRLIHDLLDLTRARLTGSLPVQPRPVDLGTVVEGVVDELHGASGDRAIEVQRRGSLEGTWDPDRLAQLASNLLANALKYGRPDRPVRVELDGSAPDAVTLRVRNEGDPISPELLGRLFQPWERAGQQAGTAQGVGLGLFIVERIAAAHGGSARATSTAEDGTAFEVRLPRHASGG
ncbi:PAS domain-containing protein [Anaeromyxobacter diazotrophicus]|uniref:histidine kinase n=1 Tax=Anaeromyxobacter diazotrophicus TaxID=2590199 RepID=A0A7I9VM25_9BACT|nr:PAS domain-containing protein [Anaeromyxobacter diazotrophicus]GEJ57455.1 hypothetical protein AMYX_21960 [Anaeromyxobacter diazotrophicus]